MTTQAQDNSGIHGHSQAYDGNHIIFSGSNTTQLAVKLDALNISYKKIFGCYHGQKEISFVTRAKHLINILEIEEVKTEESILLLGEYDARDRRKASLIFLHSQEKPEPIGWFRSTSKEVAVIKDNFSFDPSTDQYYIVEAKNAKGRLHS